MTTHKRARLYFYYDDSTTETTALQNVWEAFPYPSTALSTIRDSGDFVVSDNAGKMRITYTGTLPAWFCVSAVCNIYKGTGGNANRNVEIVWHQNGVNAGPVRGSYMNNQDSQILSGYGEIYLEENDYLEPFIRNIENDDKIKIKSCSYTFLEESDWGY